MSPEGGIPDPDFIDNPDIAAEDADPDKLDEFETGYEHESDEAGEGGADFYENLALTLSAEQHDDILRKYLSLYEMDKGAREKRDKQYEEGIKRTGVSNDAPGGADFPGASKVVHPGLAEAGIDFCARSMKELFPSEGPVRINIRGKMTKDKLDRAERKKRHMNWQCTTQIPEYRSTLENVLTQLPIGGAQFIKWYPDFLAKRPACEFVRVDNVYFPYNSEFYSAQRVFHRMELSRYEVDKRIAANIYADVEMIQTVSEPERTLTQQQIDKAEGQEFPADNEDGISEYLDIYLYDSFDFDNKASGELGPAPYQMTISVQKNKIVALYRNWEEEDSNQKKMDWMVKFGFLPWDGGLEIGLVHVGGSLSGAATGAFRALLDSALTQNIPTAVTLKGTAITGGTPNSIKSGQVTELQNRNLPGTMNIRDLIYTIPYNPPSPVLLSLLQYADEKLAGVIGSATEQAEDNQNMPVGTKLANIEQAMVVYSSIHQRLHNSQAKCLDIIHRINRMYMEEDQKYDDDLGFAVQADYEGEIDVQPVSDPNIFSESQRYGQLQAVLQLVQLFPTAQYPNVTWNNHSIIKWALSLMRLPNADEILPDPKHPKDENPAAENVMMAMGQPAIALPDQDHMAHLSVLFGFMQMVMANPVFMALYAQKFIPNAVAHAEQHILYLYGTLMSDAVEQALQVPLSQVQDDDEVVSKKFSQLVAAASPSVLMQLPVQLQQFMPMLMQAKQMADQMQAAAATNNPIMAEVQARTIEAQAKAESNQIKKEEVQVKAQAQAADIQNDQQRLGLDATESAAHQQTEQQRTQLEGERISSDAQASAAEIAARLEMNREDNVTAMQISAMRAASGRGVGGLESGDSIGEGTPRG